MFTYIYAKISLTLHLPYSNRNADGVFLSSSFKRMDFTAGDIYKYIYKHKRMNKHIHIKAYIHAHAYIFIHIQIHMYVKALIYRTEVRKAQTTCCLNLKLRRRRFVRMCLSLRIYVYMDISMDEYIYRYRCKV